MENFNFKIWLTFQVCRIILFFNYNKISKIDRRNQENMLIYRCSYNFIQVLNSKPHKKLILLSGKLLFLFKIGTLIVKGFYQVLMLAMKEKLL